MSLLKLGILWPYCANAVLSHVLQEVVLEHSVNEEKVMRLSRRRWDRQGPASSERDF